MHDAYQIKAKLANFQASLFFLTAQLNLNKDIFKSKVNESLSFVHWALGQPNNFGSDQNFVSISYPNFKWGDWSGETVGEVICQQEIKGKISGFSLH